MIKTKITLTIGFLAFLNINIFSQMKSAAIVDPFSLGSDNLGNISNAVNQFTGDLTLPLNLVNIPGREGMDINVTAIYSSTNIETLAGTWNLDAPTSILGLGWSLSSTMIIVDNNQTMSREDDTFYLMENGNSTKLICVGINSTTGVRTFKTKMYSNKIITYSGPAERWDITLEDGTKLVFGNTLANQGNAIQWTLGIGNWIGNTNQYLNGLQSGQQGVVWNLSQKINIYGDQINYLYTKSENSLGSGGTPMQTEASYLTSIRNSFGYEVDFVYKNKNGQEYMEPHTEQNEPDAYQEVYEKMYLDKILVKGDGIQNYEIDFRYTFYSAAPLSSGNNTKRLLASMVKIGSNGLQSPTMNFGYQTTGSMAGALNSVTTPNKGTVTYEYSTGVTLNNKSNSQYINADPNFSEAQVIATADYSIVTWRKLNTDGSHDMVNGEPIKVNAYTWDGEWKLSSLTNAMPYNLVKEDSYLNQDFKISTQREFFAMLLQDYSNSNFYYVYIWKKSETSIGSWSFFYDHIQFSSGSSSASKQLFTGDNFVAVSDNYGKIFRYTWGGTNWNIGPHISEASGAHYTVATDNFIISHNTAPSPDQINFYYLDGQKNWVGPISVPTTWDNGSAQAFWNANNSQAFVDPSGSQNTYFYSWNSSYNSFSMTTKQFNYNQYENFNVYNYNTLFGLGQINRNPNYVGRALRFNGIDWIDSGEQKYAQGFGEEMFAYAPTYPSATIRMFDPNQNNWTTPITVTTFGGVQFGSYVADGNFQYRLPSGAWKSSSLSTNGTGYFSFPQYFTDGNTVFFVKSGTVSGTFSLTSFSQASLGVSASFYNVEGQSTFVLWNGQPSNATQLYLIRSDPRTFNNSTIAGYSFIDYPIDKITVFDGIKNYYTSLKYELSTSITDPGISVARYNKVTTIPGSATTTSTPYGYSETYFINGISDTEIGDVFPSGNVINPSISSASSNYKLLAGQVYKTKDYDLNGNKVSERDISFSVVPVAVMNSTTTPFQIDVSYMINTAESVVSVDGVQSISDKSYNSIGQLSQQTDYTLSGGVPQETIYTSYTYGWSVYPNSLQAKNMLIQPFQIIRSKGGIQPFEGELVRYNENFTCGTCQGTIPVIYDEYSWHGTAAVSVPPPNIANTPSSDWVFEKKISSRDVTNGVEIEVKAKGNITNSMIYDNLRRFKIASITNASASLVAYTSFEDTGQGNWSWNDGTIAAGSAKTGNNYLNLGANGLTKLGLNSTDSYSVTFWAKTAGGTVNISGIGSLSLGSLTSWTLVKKTVTNVSGLTISLASGSPSVAIDEVSVVPLNAFIKTSTYHPLFGATSSTDENSHTTYIWYDGLGRPVNSLDENNNIIKNIIYQNQN